MVTGSESCAGLSAATSNLPSAMRRVVLTGSNCQTPSCDLYHW